MNHLFYAPRSSNAAGPVSQDRFPHSAVAFGLEIRSNVMIPGLEDGEARTATSATLFVTLDRNSDLLTAGEVMAELG